MKNKLSIKQKATFFILLLISILLLTLYFQNKTANNNYLVQIENAYKKSFDNISKHFRKKILQQYQLDTQNIHNENFKKSLLNNSEFLKNVEIKNIEKDSKYNQFLLNHESVLDVFADEQKEVFYKILVPIETDKQISSYAEYIIDIRTFLEAIKDFDGSNGIIYIKDGNQGNDIYLKKYYKSEIFKFMVDQCPTHKQPVFEVDDEFYVKKNLEIKDIDDKLVANAVFFLDVTKEKKDYIETARTSIITSIVLFLIAAVIVNYFFTVLIKRINKNEEELKRINKDLEQTIENEIKHRLQVQEEALQERQKSEQLLIQQSKLALLGEMIGNIAHQWRQPLMQLSAIFMYIDAYDEQGKLTPERLAKKIKDGNTIIDFMSKTIEDFRNYYKPEKQKEMFLLKECIDSALFIIESGLKASNIDVVVKYENENIELKSFKNEFSQSLLNIITNAKDILVLREIKNAQIMIEAFEDEEFITINIEDNAGGIKEDILEKIFDPYFTTKHKSQGTGIGLYMTKMIIENNMDGEISVNNTKDGARFTLHIKK